MTIPSNMSFELHGVARLMRKRFEQRSRTSGLTRAQWQVLAYLASNEGIHQNKLAHLIEVTPITLARLLDKMEDHGLVERRQHPTDRRVWLLYLTTEAHPLLDLMRSTGQTTRDEAFVGISARDQQHLLKTLCLIKSNLLAACALPVEDPEKTHVPSLHNQKRRSRRRSAFQGPDRRSGGRVRQGTRAKEGQNRH
jgi:MarR family transcriptional regulator for hemolysin